MYDYPMSLILMSTWWWGLLEHVILVAAYSEKLEFGLQTYL